MAKKQKKNLMRINAEAKSGTILLRMPRDGYSVRVPEAAPTPEPIATGEGQLFVAGQVRSLAMDDVPDSVSSILPKEEDFIYPKFRALSQVLIPGHWLDFSTPGVLKASVPLLMGVTVAKNHWHYDVEEFLGAVNQSEWDAKGEASENVPGINVELKIDALFNARIARGLMMSPPAIHDVSVKVYFEFEYSHPALIAEKGFWYFYESLGQEIDGSIVRFIVTKILKYGEISLVCEGADGLAKILPDDEDEEEDEVDDPGEADVKKKKYAGMSSLPEPPIITKEKTVKLTAEQIAALGLSVTPETELPEATILKLALDLAPQAAIGTEALTALRADVERDARLAEGLATDAPLPLAVKLSIDNANFTQLRELQKHYAEKAATLFPPTGRSSKEDVPPVAPAQAQAQAPKVSIF